MSETPHWISEQTEIDRKRDEIVDLQLTAFTREAATWEERDAWAREHAELLRSVDSSSGRAADAAERQATALESIAENLKLIAMKLYD